MTSRVGVALRVSSQYLRGMPKHLNTWVELRVLREKDGMTKTALSQTTGIALGYICDLENGRREPNAVVRKKIATALNVPVSMLEKRTQIEDVA